jgi:hypothetical protein
VFPSCWTRTSVCTTSSSSHVLFSLPFFSDCLASAGKDATEAFYGLHRHEILEKPQYARLQIGTLKDEMSVIYSRIEGVASGVPYAEPTWLSKGYHSPYYKEVSTCSGRAAKVLCLIVSFQSHRKLQQAMRKLVDRVIYPDAQLHEEDGKRPTQAVFDEMAYVLQISHISTHLMAYHRQLEVHAMRLGPGKHLKGRTLMGGIVKPEEVGHSTAHCSVPSLTLQIVRLLP